MPPLRPGAAVVARGRRWHVQSRVTHHDCEAIGLAPAETGSTQGRTLLVPFDRIEPLANRISPICVTPRRWNREVLRLIARSRPFGSLAAAAAARIDLLPFQLEPALAMRRHGRTRLLLADDVGLGKTVQAGLLLAELAREQDSLRAIVLAPAGVREQWRQELRDRFGLAALVADAAWLASATRHLPADVNPWGLPGVHVASFDLVKRPEVLRSLEEVAWDIVVVDEAHACTLHTARRAAVHAIAVRARRVLLLTATPPDGDPFDLRTLRSLGELPTDAPIVEFRRGRADIGHAVAGTRSSIQHVRLSAAERRMHRLLERYTTRIWEEAGARADPRARLAALVLRKRALSSARSLMASLHRRIQLLAAGPAATAEPSQLVLPLLDDDGLEDEAPDAVIGAPGLADASHERELLVRLERAAERACRLESKLRFLLRLLRRLREPLIVFTEYRDTLQHLERVLAGAGYQAVTLHGGMGPRERVEAQRDFSARGCVLLATDAASEGLNLHHRCRAVLHFELPWTLSRLRQRTGRVDRLGQTRRVHEILLVARHTAERMVLEPLVRRAHAARASDSRSNRLIDTLTESAVGAAVMEERPVTDSSVPLQAPQVMELRDEATTEASRIGLERRLPRGDGSQAEASRQPFVARSPRSKHEFKLLAAVCLEDAHGTRLHTSLVPISLECRLRRPVLTNADWRRLAEELSTDLRRHWQATALVFLFDELASAHAQVRVVRDALDRRAAAMLEARRSVAREIVQASLFDRRAIHARDRQRQVAALLADEYATRTRESAVVSPRTTVFVLAVR